MYQSISMCATSVGQKKLENVLHRGTFILEFNFDSQKEKMSQKIEKLVTQGLLGSWSLT